MKSCVWKVEAKDRLCKYCILTTCPERNVGGKKWGRITPRMRSMDVGQSLRFDHMYYNAARTAASRLGADYLMRFIVRHDENGCIVERIS